MYVTYLIMGVTIAVSLFAFKDSKVMSALIFNPYFVDKKKQSYRFITSGFIHNDHMHLIFNMFSLYFFGRAIEFEFLKRFGETKGIVYFVLLYILAIIVSDIRSYYKHKDNVKYNSLGASGGVAAVIFAFILFLPLENIYIYFALPLPGFILGALYIFYSWYSGRKANDNINHDAHLYGAVFGFLFCVLLYPRALPEFVEQISNWEMLKYLN